MENDRLGISAHRCDMCKSMISSVNVFAAWREFKKDKMSKKDVLAFAERAEENLHSLISDLQSGTYSHGPYHRFFVHDPKERPIAKASVRDRVLHHALCRVITAHFDKRFIFDSYSSRVDKGTHAASKRLQEFAEKVSQNHTRVVWYLKCDVRKFFDSVDHPILTQQFDTIIECPVVRNIMREVLGSFETKQKKGVPLGNLTSQLFANIYLNSLDQYVKRVLRVRYYIRYTDDFVIVSRNKTELQQLIPLVQQFLANKLCLELHQNKITIGKWHSGIDFLGYNHFPYYKLPRRKTVNRLFRKLQSKQECADENARQHFEDSRQSYLGLLSHARARRLSRKIRHIRAIVKSEA